MTEEWAMESVLVECLPNPFVLSPLIHPGQAGRSMSSSARSEQVIEELALSLPKGCLCPANR